MTKEMKIAILMADRCTKSEAEKHIKNRTTIYEAEEFVEHFDLYMDNFITSAGYTGEEADEQLSMYRDMIENDTAPTDWSVVEYQGNKYYIEYVL